jgi:hypothetical protein
MRPISKIETDDEKVTTERPPMRPEVRTKNDTREEDPRERAARRAAELRGHIQNFDDGIDKFSTPAAPDGWTYEWKRKTVMGWEDPSYMSNLTRTGWEPVPASRHPEMMTKGHVGSIERDGQVLMERPAEISDEVRRLELLKARQQVNIKAGQLDPKGRGGIIDRADAHVNPKISKGYEPIPIADK